MYNKFKKRENLDDGINIDLEKIEEEHDFFNRIDDILNHKK